MTKIMYIKPADTKGYLTLGCVRDGEKIRLTVDEETYGEIGSPLRSDVLEGENEKLALAASERYGTLLSALRILSYADNSEDALCRKLSMRGYSREAARETAREMVRLGYLDEKRQLRTVVAALANGKLYGPRKILAYAAGKGYKSENVRDVLRDLTEDGTVDFEHNLTLVYEKKGNGEPLTAEERQKWKYRYGY